MQRRTFLQTTGAAGLAAFLSRSLWALPADHRYLKTIGLQLYTLRNQLAKSVPDTLKAVADAGYYQVELMGVADAREVITAAQDVGLKATSAMIDWQTIVNPDQAGVPPFSQALDVAAKYDLRFLVIPYVGKGFRETADQLKRLAERANRAGEQCRQAKIQLCYHHHSFEFQQLADGRTGWDVFVAEFDPELVKFEIDVFWAKIGGLDPVKTIANLQGRVAQLHLKDLLPGTPTIYDESKVPPAAFKEVGHGLIEWTSVLQAAEAAGVVQCHVEQDQSPDPIASIGQSLQYLKQL